ncbi:MAG: ribonuclease HI [bacterium]|nr:ribonuclease HI [bacterium]
MAEPTFTCNTCGKSFTIKAETLAKYPGWQPAKCWQCKTAGNQKSGGAGKKRPAARRKKRGSSKEQNLPRAKVLEKYTEGPFDGIFTDGACSGNPGPGGWGTVWVKDNEVLEERHGHDPQTTNNRMELAALIAAYEMLPEDAEVTIWSDSNLCVQTINQWAAGWKRMGWTRKKGAEVKNLELVRRAYELSLRRRGAKLRWIKAHNGSRWNEYADSLATAYTRDEL